MEYFELMGLISTPHILIPRLNKNWKPLFQLEAFKNYDVINHNVNNKIKRPKKKVKRPNGIEHEGKQGTEIIFQEVNRISIPFQKLIVETATIFLTGGTVDLKALPKDNTSEQALLEAVQTSWNRNKLQYLNSTIAECMMSQMEVAELWFRDKDEEGNDVMKVQILTPALGYTLQPVYDSIGNMVAFAVYYNQVNDKGEKTQVCELYTDKELRKFHNVGQGWIIAKIANPDFVADENNPDAVPDLIDAVVELPYKKIPIIYYSQPRSEWYDVQSMIDRLETMISNQGDINDYSGSPILFADGDIENAPNKGETGKFIKAKRGTNGNPVTLKYITPENSTESYKEERDFLRAQILFFSNTVDLSLESLKGLGQIPTGAAMERLLIWAYMKARRKQSGSFGMGLQRRINFMKYAEVALNDKLEGSLTLDIKPNFNPYSVTSVSDRIADAMAANGGKPVLSQEESVSFAGTSDDPAATWNKIKTEQSALGNVLDPENVL